MLTNGKNITTNTKERGGREKERRAILLTKDKETTIKKQTRNTKERGT